MSRYTITRWQDIPAVVEAKAGRQRHKIQLSERFQKLIDHVAMRKKLVGTDDYLAMWSKGDSQQRDGSPEQVAREVAAELESCFDEIRTEAMAAIETD